MFLWKWAAKNLLNNRRKTLKRILFFAIMSSLLFLSVAFLNGTTVQMKASIRESQSDLFIANRVFEGDISPVLTFLAENYSREMETMIPRVSFSEFTLHLDRYYTDEGVVYGTTPEYIKKISPSLSWLEKEDDLPFLTPGTIILDINLAEQLKAKTGENLIMTYITKAGVINTKTFRVAGVFMGNALLYENVAYVNIRDAQELALEEERVNEILVYLKQGVSKPELLSMISTIRKDFLMDVIIEAWELNPEHNLAYYMFKIVRGFVQFIFYLLNLVFLLIIYLSIQDSFYINFRARREELSSLKTFGMKDIKIYFLAFYEGLYLFILGTTLGYLTARGVTMFLKGVKVINPQYNALMMALGGPNVVFDFKLSSLLFVGGFILFSTLLGVHTGIRNYLKMEVRAVISAV